MANRFYTTEINPEEYIGESLLTINNNFNNLDTLQQTTTAVVDNLAFVSTLALSGVGINTTSITNINTRLNQSGAFYVPKYIYVDSTLGSDSSPTPSDSGTPYASLTAAFTYLYQLARPTVDGTGASFEYNIVLLSPGNYFVNNAINLKNIPGRVVITGNTPVTYLSGFTSSKDYQSVTYTTSLDPTPALNSNSVKIYYTRGKEAEFLPGAAYVTTGSLCVTGINNTAFTRTLSAPFVDPATDPYVKNYVIINNELKMVTQVLSDTQFLVDTPFTATASGVPIIAGDYTNYIANVGYTGSQNNREFSLSAVNWSQNLWPGPLNASFTSHLLSALTISVCADKVPIPPAADAYFAPNDILFYNNTASTITSAGGNTVFVNVTGSMLADDYRSKTTTTPSVVGITKPVPFFVKRAHQLHRGVYDFVRINPTNRLITLSSFNIPNPGPDAPASLALQLSASPDPVLSHPIAQSTYYAHTLPTTIYFNNSASAGFNLENSFVEFRNVYIRGSKNYLPINGNINLVPGGPIRGNVGILADRGSKVILQSDCAVANFDVGINVAGKSYLGLPSSYDGTEAATQRNGIFSPIGAYPLQTITDNNSIGIGGNNNSAIIGQQFIVSNNGNTGISLGYGSTLVSNYIDIHQNGYTGLALEANSTAYVRNTDIMFNYYAGAITTANSQLVLDTTPANWTYSGHYDFAPCIIGNSNLSNIYGGVVVRDSNAIIDGYNIINNGYNPLFVNSTTSNTPVIYAQENTNLTVRNSVIANNKKNIGIYGAKNQTILQYTNIFDCASAIYVPNSGHVDGVGIMIRNSWNGLACDDASVVHFNQGLGYPYVNNFFVSCEYPVYVDGNFINTNIRGETPHFKNMGIYTTPSSINTYNIFTTSQTMVSALSGNAFPPPNQNSYNPVIKIGDANSPAFDTGTRNIVIDYRNILPS